MAESVLPAVGVEGRTHYFPADRVHFTWDVGNEPVLTIASGDTVVVQTRDVSDNQITPESTAADLDIDWDRVYPLAGPIAVEGAEPGHTLASQILDLHTLGWGWTAILPELGPLPDDFLDPYLRIFDLTGGEVMHLREDIAIPIAPFLGTMGSVPQTRASRRSCRPGRSAGTWTRGSSSAGQCSTCRYRWRVPGPLAPQVDTRQFLRHDGGRSRPLRRSAGSGARDDRLPVRDLRPEPGDAYVLSSLCVDLKISEIVDAGQYVVSVLVPLAIFRG